MKKKLLISLSAFSTMALSLAVTVGATATSLLPDEVTTMVTDFSADIVPTALGLLTILVPIGLTLWAIGFGVKKAIAFVQRKANKAV